MRRAGFRGRTGKNVAAQITGDRRSCCKNFHPPQVNFGESAFSARPKRQALKEQVAKALSFTEGLKHINSLHRLASKKKNESEEREGELV